jgi:hypothetical protein
MLKSIFFFVYLTDNGGIAGDGMHGGNDVA